MIDIPMGYIYRYIYIRLRHVYVPTEGSEYPFNTLIIHIVILKVLFRKNIINNNIILQIIFT